MPRKKRKNEPAPILVEPRGGIDAESKKGVEGDASANPAKNNVYEKLTAAGLTELDKIARFILAIAFSGQWTKEKLQAKSLVDAAEGADLAALEEAAERQANREQSFVAQRTVAVAYHGTELIVAANDLWNASLEDPVATKARVCEELRKAAFSDPVTFIDNPISHEDKTVHAEVQLVNHFHTRQWRFEEDAMGVSKPCCMLCAVMLDDLGVSYSYFHREGVGKGRVPASVATPWWN
ncbi:nucleic acid/nucleotide deaminase domain-containing protein [Paraburkholderia bannensis]|uniref:nucleic acid/nucleotide deaminase domain-containing protein n=1 Tax=Paraburkholderia bannensis TaxID=765414 RepID=UPI002AB6CDA1|nr:nucleic acid/nucleotide deaminase domain-containing protein [Paraburkholderia bannensis]